MSGQHVAHVPTAHRVALGAHFGPPLARTVAPGKRQLHRQLPRRYGCGRPCPVPPRVVGARGHAQRLAEQAPRPLLPTPGDALVSAHRVGWPKMTTAFFKMSSSCSARLRRARSARTSGPRATSTLPTSATSCACCQRYSSLGRMPNPRAPAWVLRLSDARRRTSASALNASSYLRRLSGDAPLDLVALTEETYVLLLSGLPRPPHPTSFCRRAKPCVAK